MRADGTNDYHRTGDDTFTVDYVFSAQIASLPLRLSADGNTLTLVDSHNGMQKYGPTNYQSIFLPQLANRVGYTLYPAVDGMEWYHQKPDGSFETDAEGNPVKAPYVALGIWGPECDLTFSRIYPQGEFIPEDGIFYESDQPLVIVGASTVRLRLAFLPVARGGDQVFSYNGLKTSADPATPEVSEVSGVNMQYRPDPDGSRGYNLVVFNACNRGIFPDDDGQYRGWRGTLDMQARTLAMEPLPFYDNLPFRSFGAWPPTDMLWIDPEDPYGAFTYGLPPQNNGYDAYSRQRYYIAPPPDDRDISQMARNEKVLELPRWVGRIVPVSEEHSQLLQQEPWTELPGHTSLEDCRIIFPTAVAWNQNSYHDGSGATIYEQAYESHHRFDLSLPMEYDITHQLAVTGREDYQVQRSDQGMQVQARLHQTAHPEYVVGYDVLLVDNNLPLADQAICPSEGILGAVDITHKGTESWFDQGMASAWVEDPAHTDTDTDADSGTDTPAASSPLRTAAAETPTSLLAADSDGHVQYGRSFTTEELQSLLPDLTDVENAPLSIFLRAHYTPQSGLAPTYHSLLAVDPDFQLPDQGTPITDVDDEPTGTELPLAEQPFAARATAGGIALSGITGMATIYDACGRTIATTASDAVIPLRPGIYFVRHGSSTAKLAVGR